MNGRHGTVLLFVAIVGVGGALRATGLSFGFPLQLRPDETRNRAVIADLAGRSDWNPHFFAYPGLAFYLPLGILHAAHATEGVWNPGLPGRSFTAFVEDKVTAIHVLRVSSACFGTLTLLVVFLIGPRCGGTPGGLAAAALLAGSFLHVRDSHFATADVPAALAVAIAVLAMLAGAKSGRLWWFLASGLFIGLGAALKYLPAILLLPAGMAAWMAGRSQPPGSRVRHAAAALVVASSVASAAFLAGAPYTVLAFGEFWEGFSAQTRASLQGEPQPLATGAHLVSIGLPLAVGLPVALAALVGACSAAWRSRAGLIVVVGAVTYAALISCIPNTYYRYLLPIIPFICVLAGTLCVQLAARFPPRWRTGSAVLFVAAIAIDPLWRSIAIDRLFVRRTTYEEVLAVIAAQFDRPRVCAPISRSIGTDLDPLMPLNPLDWPDRQDVLVILARHPHPAVGDEWASFRAAFEASSAAERLVDVRAFDDIRTTGARFEQNDAFLYPLAGFAGVERGGPDLVLYRIHRVGSAASRPSSCAAPTVVIERIGDRRQLVISAPEQGLNCLPVAYYARTQDGPVVRPDAWSPPMFQPYCTGVIAIPDNLPRGRSHIEFALFTLDGLGPWSAPVVLDVP